MKRDYFRKLFKQYDREKFADWFWRGLYSFYNAPASKRGESFDEAGRIILEYESICEGLAIIYEEFVPPKKQLAFRQAIGDVIREKSNDYSEMVHAFQDLIYLIIRIKASESLSSLLPTVGSGVFGQQHPEVLYETITALASLAPSDYAYKTASTLIDSANFDDGYLFEAIKVLVECKPSDAAKIVLKFEPRLTQLYTSTKKIGGVEFKVFCEAAEDWAEVLLSKGTITWLSELYEKASHSFDQKWLFSCLFFNDAVPAFLDWDGQNTFRLIYRGKKLNVRVSRKDYYTRKMLLNRKTTTDFYAWVNDPNDKVNQIHLNPPKKAKNEKTPTLGDRISAKSECYHISKPINEDSYC